MMMMEGSVRVKREEEEHEEQQQTEGKIEIRSSSDNNILLSNSVVFVETNNSGSSISGEELDSSSSSNSDNHLTKPSSTIVTTTTTSNKNSKKETKSSKKASNNTSTNNIKAKRRKSNVKKESESNENSEKVFKKNQPVVIEVDGTTSKNRTILEGFYDHKYEIGRPISFKKCNVNGHPTIYTKRPITVIGTIGAMVVNEKSSRRIGQDRIQVYGVSIGKNRYAWVTENVLDQTDQQPSTVENNSSASNNNNCNVKQEHITTPPTINNNAVNNLGSGYSPQMIPHIASTMTTTTTGSSISNHLLNTTSIKFEPNVHNVMAITATNNHPCIFNPFVFPPFPITHTTTNTASGVTLNNNNLLNNINNNSMINNNIENINNNRPPSPTNIKKRKREVNDQNKQTVTTILPSPPLKTITHLHPTASNNTIYPNFPQNNIVNNNNILQTTNNEMSSKLYLESITPNRADSKKSQHFILNVCLNNDISKDKKHLFISHLLSPLAPPMTILFIDKLNSNNFYTITKKHVLTPLNEHSKHDFEIFSYTPLIRENKLDCFVKLIFGNEEILNENFKGLDFEFYSDGNNSEQLLQNTSASIIDDNDVEEKKDHEMDCYFESGNDPFTALNGEDNNVINNEMDAFNLFDQYQMMLLRYCNDCNKSDNIKDLLFKMFSGRRDAYGYSLLHHFVTRGLINESLCLIRDFNYNPMERDFLGNTVLDLCNQYQENNNELMDVLNNTSINNTLAISSNEITMISNSNKLLENENTISSESSSEKEEEILEEVINEEIDEEEELSQMSLTLSPTSEFSDECTNVNSPTSMIITFSEFFEELFSEHNNYLTIELVNQIMFQLFKTVKKFYDEITNNLLNIENNILINPEMNLFISKINYLPSIINIKLNNNNNNCNIYDLITLYIESLPIRYWSPEILIMSCYNNNIINNEMDLYNILMNQNIWTLGIIFCELLFIVNNEKRRSLFGYHSTLHLLIYSQLQLLLFNNNNNNNSSQRDLKQLMEYMNRITTTVTNNNNHSNNNISTTTNANTTSTTVNTNNNVSDNEKKGQGRPIKVGNLNAKEKERILMELAEHSTSTTLTTATTTVNTNNNNKSTTKENNSKWNEMFSKLLPKSGIELLESIFKWNGENRITIDNIIDHPYWIENELNKRRIKDDLMRKKMLSQISVFCRDRFSILSDLCFILA
ncbi:hypothetical protein ABK040_016863 [Willaertia magna]